jgi:hypothetical protein
MPLGLNPGLKMMKPKRLRLAVLALFGTRVFQIYRHGYPEID